MAADPNLLISSTTEKLLEEVATNTAGGGDSYFLLEAIRDNTAPVNINLKLIDVVPGGEFNLSEAFNGTVVQKITFPKTASSVLRVSEKGPANTLDLPLVDGFIMGGDRDAQLYFIDDPINYSTFIVKNYSNTIAYIFAVETYEV